MGALTSGFIARMEALLGLYALPYDPQYPVVCFDERPCFLLGEVVEPAPMQTGQVAKEHYAYEKNGSCTLFGAIEPLTGKRLAQVQTRRTKREYTRFCQALAAQYPEAIQIQLVQDNLNTHNTSAFYEYLSAPGSLCLSTTLRLSLHPEIRQLAQHDRNRVFCPRPWVFTSTHSDSRAIRAGGPGVSARTS